MINNSFRNWERAEISHYFSEHMDFTWNVNEFFRRIYSKQTPNNDFCCYGLGGGLPVVPFFFEYLQPKGDTLSWTED